MRQTLLTWGEPAPWFVARATNNPEYKFSSLGGCYVVLCFFQSAARADSRQILGDLWNARGQFDDDNVCFFGVSTDPEDQRQERVRQNLPGMRFFWDFDESVSQQYGAVPNGAAAVEPASASGYRAHTLGMVERHRLSDHTANRHAAHHCLTNFQPIEQGDHVARQIHCRIRWRRSFRQAMTAQVVTNHLAMRQQARRHAVPNAQIAAQGVREKQRRLFLCPFNFVVMNMVADLQEWHRIETIRAVTTKSN